MISEYEKTTRDKFNYLKKYYDETWDEASHTLHIGLFKSENDSLSTAYKQATDYLIENTKSLVPINKDSMILDVGCGSGRTLTELCLKYGCSGIGIDLSDEHIKDANTYLQSINNIRTQSGLSKISARFIRGSGSNLEKILKKDEQFTHIISQDAIFLITNKKSFFNNVRRLLKPGGVFAIADFLSESAEKNLTQTERNLIYQLVNWKDGLSFDSYLEILKTIDLRIFKSERRDIDMVRTYEQLVHKMERYILKNDKTYIELKDRYQSIASAVKSGKMGWGFFFAKKS